MNNKNITDTLRCWAEIDLDAIEYNFDAVHNRLPENTLHLAVVKADSYGHGAVKIAKTLENKADYFAVALADEALQLRKAGINKPILILGQARPSDYNALIENDITLCLADDEDAKYIIEASKILSKRATVHIAVDTGMSRIGFQCCDDSAAKIADYCSNEYIYVEGLFSHFAMADSHDKTYAEAQISNFDRLIAALDALKVKIPIKHLYNSAASIDLPIKYDMVREGISLYGMYPSPEVNLSNIGGIHGVMSLRAHISHLKTIADGIHVSYGCTYTTSKETKIATVSAGYADGVPRLLSNKGYVIIRGVKCPIIGRVCMDQFMVDVSNIQDAAKGDIVTIFGEDNGVSITPDQVAESVGTIGYELTCGINKRVPRVYIKNNIVDEVIKNII